MSANKIIECTNFANKIARNVYEDIKSRINEQISENQRVNLGAMCLYGNELIMKETQNVYKKCKNKGIAFPVSISLNNCVGNYVNDVNGVNDVNDVNGVNDVNDVNEHTGDVIVKGDVVKVELGVAIDGYIGIVGETFVAGGGLEKELGFLDELSKEIVLRAGDTNDMFRMFIESECTKNNMYPIENCTSYQHYENHLKTDGSKYMILNYRKYWDEDDNLVSEENFCYEFEENEVYTINLTFALSDQQNLKYKEPIEPRLFRFNETNYGLKLNSSRLFLNEVKAKHRNYVFNITEFLKNPKMKVGMRECFGNGILDSFPILYATETNNNPVQIIHKKFTVIVKSQRKA
jgi:methionine aminopeptidase